MLFTTPIALKGVQELLHARLLLHFDLLQQTAHKPLASAASQRQVRCEDVACPSSIDMLMCTCNNLTCNYSMMCSTAQRNGRVDQEMDHMQSLLMVWPM